MAVVATGFFDGVHPGHRLVISTLLAEAQRRGEEGLVVTFWPHPRTVLQKDARNFHILSTPEEKKELLMEAGAEFVKIIPFTRDFASLTAEQYLKFVMFEYDASCVILGYDTRLGSDQKGPEEIARMAAAMHLDAIIAPPFKGVAPEGENVSSTKVRRALEEGSVALASEMLGRPYKVHGVVVSGKQKGRTIGYPTANVRLYNPLKLIPGPGVYFSRVEVLGCEWYGMTNVAVDGSIETHILDFTEEIYGLDIKISFLDRIRDEHLFESLDALKVQLASDEQACRERFV